MNSNADSPLSGKILLLFVSVVTIFLSWIVVRSSLVQISVSATTIRLLDIGIVVATGFTATVLLARLVAGRVAALAGPTQTNAVRLLLQLSSLVLVIVVVLVLTGPTGSSFVSALVGIGFFGIVLGLAAQEVLGNLFSGLMLIAARPFHINERIAVISWQYGKFPPTLPHGWLEPSYTGVVKRITLVYTEILTDSNALLKIPNRIVTQALVMNLTHSRQGYVAVQFEVPITVDPDRVHKNLDSQLSRQKSYTGKEENFEILDISASGYIIAISHKVENSREREMKDLLLRAIRLALIQTNKNNTK